jgi:hypothetical protein
MNNETRIERIINVAEVLDEFRAYLFRGDLETSTTESLLNAIIHDAQAIISNPETLSDEYMNNLDLIDYEAQYIDNRPTLDNEPFAFLEPKLKLTKVPKKHPDLKKDFHCPICLDSYNRTNVVIPECGHPVCLNCSVALFQRQKREKTQCQCPMCRTVVTRLELLFTTSDSKTIRSMKVHPKLAEMNAFVSY